MIRSVLARDLRAVARELAAYPDDDVVWRVVPGISNSAGTLTLHLAGNLEHYIGATLGGTGYVRDRDAEFATRGLTRAELRSRVEAAARSVDATLARLGPEQYEAAYPVAVGGRTLATGDFLLHLAAHVAFHLGQIDYHRRMLLPDARPIDAISIAELPER